MPVNYSLVFSGVSIVIASMSAIFSYQANVISRTSLSFSEEKFVATINKELDHTIELKPSANEFTLPFIKTNWKIIISNVSTNTSTIDEYSFLLPVNENFPL